MLKVGEVNNCLKCGASYSQYDEKPNNDWAEQWCAMPTGEIEKDGKIIKLKTKEPKGLCQFCNPKSKYYIEK